MRVSSSSVGEDETFFTRASWNVQKSTNSGLHGIVDEFANGRSRQGFILSGEWVQMLICSLNSLAKI